MSAPMARHALFFQTRTGLRTRLARLIFCDFLDAGGHEALLVAIARVDERLQPRAEGVQRLPGGADSLPARLR